MNAFNRYFDSEIRGFDLIPKDRPVLLVGNHSGGVLTPDTCKLLSTWFERRKDQTLVGLAFDAAFSIPVLAPIMRKIGQVPASHQNALKALEEGCSVLVYPGGAHEVFRPWMDRNAIDFAGHKDLFVWPQKPAFQSYRSYPMVGTRPQWFSAEVKNWQSF